MLSFYHDILATGRPLSILAPMDGYTDSPYRQIVKRIAPETIVFSEFYSADGLVHSRELQRKALTHDPSEFPLVIQIFGKDPVMFREAAKIIESYGVAGIDINMGCPAKKVVKSGHGSSLMINRDTAFRIVEEMAKAVKIPVSVKTRLGWDNYEPLMEFATGLQNAGASLITVHGRTYKQAFTGHADFTGIYELKRHLSIPVVCNGDIMDYDDGVRKLRNSLRVGEFESLTGGEVHSGLPSQKSDEENEIEGVEKAPSQLDGFMIGRASFGNPWCFLPGRYQPSLREILDTMTIHGELLWQWKARKGMLEARKHLVQYLHSLPGVREYRSRLVHVESLEDIIAVIETIRSDHSESIDLPLSRETAQAFSEAWSCESPGNCG